MILIIKKMYRDINIELSIEKAKTFFISTSRVKQWDNLSPVLFLFAILGQSKEFQKMVKEEEYILEPTGSYSSAQNGLAEKPNQDLAGVSYMGQDLGVSTGRMLFAMQCTPQR